MTPPVPQSPDDRAAVELALANRCAAGDERALAELEQRYFPELRRALAQRSANPAHIDEVVQRLRATVLTRRGDRPAEIASFSASGPLASWLRIAALRILLRFEKKERRGRDPAVVEAILDRAGTMVVDPERLLLKRSGRQALQAALRDAWEALDAADRLRLKLRYADGNGIDRIAAIEGVHRATAARRVGRAEEHLVSGARSYLRERLRMSDGEIESVLRVLTSQLDVSLGFLMGRTGEPPRG